MYIFFFLNFNPPNIPAKKKGGRLGWVSFYEHLLPRRTVDLPTPRLPPAHVSPAQPRMGTRQSWWGNWEAGRGSSALGSGVGLRLRGGGELPKCSHLCSVTEPRSLAGAEGNTAVCEAGEAGCCGQRAGQRRGWTPALALLTDDLPGPPVARHASLRGPSVAAHL